MKKLVLMAILALGAANGLFAEVDFKKLPATVFVKVDPINGTCVLSGRDNEEFDVYVNKQGREIRLKKEKKLIFPENRIYYDSSVQKRGCYRKNVSGFQVLYQNDTREFIEPNMDTPHYKNCVSDEKYHMSIILLNAKENIFYEQMLKDLVAHKTIVKSEYEGATNLMEKELGKIKNDIDDEWSRMSFLQRLGNYFSIKKRYQVLSEACQKKHELGLNQHKTNFEAIEQEVQSFTNSVNRKSLTQSWMKKSNAKNLQSARDIYEQDVRD